MNELKFVGIQEIRRVPFIPKPGTSIGFGSVQKRCFSAIKWQAALKRSDPGNPLPNYLLAFGLFQIVLFAASACPTDKNPGVTRRSDFQFC